MKKKIFVAIIGWIIFSVLTALGVVQPKTFEEAAFPLFISFLLWGATVFCPLIYDLITLEAEKKTEQE